MLTVKERLDSQQAMEGYRIKRFRKSKSARDQVFTTSIASECNTTTITSLY
ncbi:hypothetical protein SAMN04488104_102714 [Algoriphagus faecimaris]|uniref:Uncharacterized protein n=1 Tax=Algoriphagus faecimaris TaxID=686796 RepID=A0A1G6U908_9BACT|nr:hypothetical protein SAMN04488104_102714 [Algoriphagus faecimaris]